MATKIMAFEDETDRKRISDVVAAHFDRFRTQREDIDEAYDISDWMYKCGTYRGTFDTERSTWVPRYVDGKANVGSTLLHRQVNTLAGMLGAILLSGRDLWRYTDKPTKGNPDSEETGAMTADQMNAMARWVQKSDKFEQKIPEFCVAIFKHSNNFAHIAMKREKRDVWEAELVAEADGVDANGDPQVKFRKKMKRRKGIGYEYPTVTFPYPRSIYADKYIRDIENQECVVMLSQTTITKLMKEGKWLDQDEISKLDIEKIAWDGNFGGEGKQDEQDNAHRTADTPTGIILRWDAYVWLPVQDGKVIDPAKRTEKEREEAYEMRLYWCVFVGNSIEDAVLLKCTDEFDPDGEIPLKEVRAVPDDSDMLYHTFLGEVVRAMYAADCASMNAAIDHDALTNDPPMTVLMGQHRIKDFTNKSGQIWNVTTHDALKRWDVPQTQLATLALRDQIRQDIKLALATDDAKTGEYAGARTSATEVLRVTSATDATISLRNAYIVGQLLPWIAKKYLSYCREFMDTEVRQRILNEMLFPEARGEYVGDFDVTVDIVGQYEDDMQREIGLDRMMQTLANPAFLQSASHRIDVGELVRMYVEHKRLPVGKLVLPPNTQDSESNARQRIQTMLTTGQYIPPKEGENTEVHMRVARGERLRWRGLETSGDPRAANVELIDQYIQDLQGAAQQAQAPQAALPGPMTPGQEAAAPVAAELGAAMGGMQ